MSHGYLAGTNFRESNGYVTGWYECNCCPYGYHIDLDFVRYCESIEKQTECTGSIKRRKDRRKQRQSMEVLLGLTPIPPLLSEIDQDACKTIQEQESPRIVEKTQVFLKNNPFVDDSLDDVVNDFERTLQRSKKRVPHNLPDVTAVSENIRRAPSVSSVSSSASSLVVSPEIDKGICTGGKDFDTVSVESCGLSPAALHNIREQMALSLHRTRELEEQVKIIPVLKAQIRELEKEKKVLDLNATNNLNKINGNYLPADTKRERSQSFTEIDTLGQRGPPPPPPLRRDFGVMCGVLTRNVGVGHQGPKTKTVATTTPDTELVGYTDKWLEDKMKFLNINRNYVGLNDLGTKGSSDLRTNDSSTKDSNIPPVPPKPLQYAQGTQTPIPRENKETSSQTLPQAKKSSSTGWTQTTETPKVLKHIGVTVSPKVISAFTQQSVETRSVGVSDNSIEDILCSKCKVEKVSQAVGPDSSIDSHISPICLANLALPNRSKSFNLGEDKLNLNVRNRSVGCQRDYIGHHKGCQYETKTSSKSCQSEIEMSHKCLQVERRPDQSKTTDTTGLVPPLVKKSIACEAKEAKKYCVEAGSNTDPYSCLQCVEYKEKDNARMKEKEREKEKDREKDRDTKREEGTTPSRIPRPQIPTTPVENRKFKRQDTYTKIPGTPPTPVFSGISLSSPEPSPSPTIPSASYSPFSAAPPPVGLSGLDLTYKSTESTSAIEKVKQTLKVPQLPSAQNGVNSAKDPQQEILSISESSVYQTTAQSQNRKKSEPSKEMQGAMKVLNDHLQKSSNKNLKNQLKNAIGIIQQEWFQVSSLVTANPLDVEDYLDCFEDISYALLEYIVNMGDASGNTAMHYAVSHGNFDVVSILLDSKVCDINKQNNAGYTSIMLVSLAEVRSQTHANVVRRLFQLADVNIRAKQHGQTALMLAVSHGRLDMVQMLLEAGADINIQDEDGSSALMCAAEHGHIDIVKYFLSQSECDSRLQDVDGSTALNIAMEAGHRHIGVLLYAHERNLQGPKYKGKSKSTSASPKTPSSPHLPLKNLSRALPDSRNK